MSWARILSYLMTWIFYCPLSLPNGASLVATHKGSVRLLDYITVTYVLFVLKLSCNLLPISQSSDDIMYYTI